VNEATQPLQVAPRGSLTLHEPFGLEEAENQIQKALASGFVSSVGPVVEEFSRGLENATRVKYAIPLVNGTSALQLALYLEGVRPNEEVLVPAMSFIATANAVRFLGAVPIFLDSSPISETTSLSLSDVSFQEILESQYVRKGTGLESRVSGRRLAAVVAVHTLGRYDPLHKLRETASIWGLPVVEDGAASLGSWFGGEHSGSQATAILSFNGNKIITTGGGGALLTNSEELALRAKEMSATAKIPHSWRFRHKEAGWNFRLPALNAALGVSQLELLPEILRLKEKLRDYYQGVFEGNDDLYVIQNPPESSQNNWLIPVAIRDPEEGLIEEVLDILHAEGVLCRPMWDLIPEQVPYGSQSPSGWPNASEIRKSVICLPSSPALAL
jgi:perosamine synthetase